MTVDARNERFLTGPTIHCNEHLLVKSGKQKGILCDKAVPMAPG